MKQLCETKLAKINQKCFTYIIIWYIICLGDIMNEKVLNILEKIKIIEFQLDNLIYGSIEIREANNNKYLYCHARDNGVQTTKYIGEYTDVLYDMIVKNNAEAKKLKQELRKLERELNRLGYLDLDFNEDVALNIDFAKKHMVDTIYTQAILEGVATTLLDTENIIEGGIINNMSVSDIMKIVNLKHAWEFILDKNVIKTKTNYSILCTINKLVEEGFYYNAGIIRSTPVKIGGTKWTPNIPIEIDIIDNINNIVNKPIEKVEIAIELLLYVVRTQIFIDGNKRTSIIFANHYLISNGVGMIVIPTDRVAEYKKLLVNYYETNNGNKITSFLKKCFITYNK